MICSRCKRRPAVYFRRVSGEKLCKECFIKSVEQTVFRTLRLYKLSRNEKFLLAASGGKDSTALLTILPRIERKYSSEIIAVTIIEGHPESFRENALKYIKLLCKKMNIVHKVVTFKEHYGYTLSELWERALNRNIRLMPCTICGVLRRKMINEIAKEENATRIVTGHNLDDEAQTIIMNVLRGDDIRLLRLGAEALGLIKYEGFVPRIKPLRYVPEREVALYCYFKKLPLPENICPFVEYSMRKSIREYLYKLEKKNPSIKYNIVKCFDRLSMKMVSYLKKKSLSPCIKCGYPTSRKICRACEILEKLS